MISRDVRSQFTIFIFMGSADQNTEIKGALVEAGYESFLFVDQETLVARVKEAAPHVILFSSAALLTPLSEFVTQVLQLNAEVQFACVAPEEQAPVLREYQEYNFSAMISTGENWANRSIWNIDLICEVLYRTYQNESLLSKYENLDNEFQNHRQICQKEIRELREERKSPKEISISEKIEIYGGCQSKDDFLLTFLKQIPTPVIFFKFLPSVSSFVATFSQGLDIEEMKGVGCRMSDAESRDVRGFLESGNIPLALHELMKEGLQVSEYHSKLVTVPNGIEGLFLIWAGHESNSDGSARFKMEQMENDFLIFELIYRQAYLIKRNESLDVHDSTTKLLNKNQFHKKLNEEIARARRTERPVSVVRISVDRLPEIEESFGRSNRDLILRTIASILKKTSRINDYSCRTEDNEFSLILPYCSRKGAALRAERLRRIIEGHGFAMTDLKVTISCGVSEYPSLTTSAEDLDISAGKALEFIIGRGGNKVCLYKPLQGIKPDFVVPLG